MYGRPVEFYLGTHEPSWLHRISHIPLFVSTRRLQRLKSYQPATTNWALDSGGFTELEKYGRWETPPHRYVARVRRYHDEIGRLDWAAPQDWMCEPHMLARTGLTVREHQTRTVRNYLDLRTLWPDGPFIPVLQGQTVDDYLGHVWDYSATGVDLTEEPLVGIGSVCRRQATSEIRDIVMALQPLRLHGFGVKAGGLELYGQYLHSSDSMAWSLGGRLRPQPYCSKRHCGNCLHEAIRWRRDVVTQVA
ncbi:MAG: hypothetical protein GY773_00905 [Actinomycetia bacterium]|nr:hypothetical protein [Actinomycetes bacterium]